MRNVEIAHVIGATLGPFDDVFQSGILQCYMLPTHKARTLSRMTLEFHLVDGISTLLANRHGPCLFPPHTWRGLLRLLYVFTH